MKVSYFPGCTLKNKAKDLDFYAYKSAEALGVTLEEIENWQCCGGVFTTAKNEVATKLSSVRALKEACVALGFLTAEKFDEVFRPEEMAYPQK